MALGEFLIFLRRLLDSDPEIVASFSLCGHARRQQRQWHAFSWFGWSWCYVPDVRRQKWPRSWSTTAVALFSWFCLSSCTSRCAQEVCRQDVATLVVNNGSGTILLVLLVFIHLGCVPDDCWQVQLWRHATDHGDTVKVIQLFAA